MMEWSSEAYKIKAPIGSLVKIFHGGKTEFMKVLTHHNYNVGHSMTLYNGFFTKKLKFRLGHDYTPANWQEYTAIPGEEGSLIYFIPRAGWYRGKNGEEFLLIRSAVKDFCVGLYGESHSVLAFKNNCWQGFEVDNLEIQLTQITKSESGKKDVLCMGEGAISQTLSLFKNSIYFLRSKIGFLKGDSLYLSSPELMEIINRELGTICKVKHF